MKEFQLKSLRSLNELELDCLRDYEKEMTESIRDIFRDLIRRQSIACEARTRILTFIYSGE